MQEYTIEETVLQAHNLVIMPCSGSKLEGGDHPFHVSFPELSEERQKLREQYCDPSKEHLRKKLEKVERIRHGELLEDKCMPAYKRYSGKMYGPIQEETWSEWGRDNILIFSALFGLIKSTDFIPWYDLSINDAINGQIVAGFWKNSKVLQELIESYCDDEEVVFAGFSGYKKAFKNFDHLKGILVKGTDRRESIGNWINQVNHD